MNQLNLYHIFYVVAQCGNISTAAKKLFISQPAVSKSITKLEENYPTPLLQRSSKGVTLTENGSILYNQLETAFQAIRQGEDLIQRNDLLGIGQISIGVSTTLCKYELLPYLHQFTTNNPNIKISISCQSTYETIAALENGTLDIGLVGESERLNNLIFKPIHDIQDKFVTTKDYLEKLVERANNPDSEKDLFSHATFLLLNKNNVTRQYVDKYMILHDITLEHQIEVTTMDLLIDFAKIGLGIACVIGDYVEGELANGSLVEFPIKDAIPKRSIGLAYQKLSYTSLTVQKFINTILPN